MWHPVGPLRARVYWRRRLVVLAVLLAVVGGASWLTLTLVQARAGNGDGTPSAASSSPVPTPALEQVLPSVSSVATPTPPDVTAAAAAASAAAQAAARAKPTAPAPVAGGPCSDEMISLVVRSAATVAPASKPTFQIVVTNTSAVPCVRALDKNLREVVLQDGQGRRIWGSNDCFPETSSESHTFAPGEAAPLLVTWGGLTSEPTCTQPRTAPGPGSYLLVARLGTKVSAKLPVTLG